MKLSVALAPLLALVAIDSTAAQNSTKECLAIGYICPKTYEPVCGTNGRTYDTECDLKSVQCETDGLEVKSTGPCYTCKTTTCPTTRDPVCGSDRKTYNNECALVLAKCKGVNVAREYFGACPNATAGTNNSTSVPAPSTAPGGVIGTAAPNATGNTGSAAAQSASTLAIALATAVVAVVSLAAY